MRPTREGAANLQPRQGSECWSRSDSADAGVVQDQRDVGAALKSFVGLCLRERVVLENSPGQLKTTSLAKTELRAL